MQISNIGINPSVESEQYHEHELIGHHLYSKTVEGILVLVFLGYVLVLHSKFISIKLILIPYISSY